MSLEITIDTKQLTRQGKYAKRIKNRVANFDEGKDPGLAKELAKIVQEDLNMRFLTAPATEVGGEVWGGAYWKPLSQYTFNLHPNRRGGKIHIDTGRLWKASITPGGESLYELRDNQFKFEILVDYAAKLQQWRQILFWHPVLVEKLTKKISTYMVETPSKWEKLND